LALWIVRAGDKGQQEEKAMNLNVVTIGWDKLPDLSEIKNRSSLQTKYLEFYPTPKKGKISNVVGQIWNFINDIKIGDLVGLPLKTKDSEVISLGLINGNYEYNGFEPDVKHIRRVKWLKSVAISEFEQVDWKKLYVPKTVFRCNKKIESRAIELLREIPEFTLVKPYQTKPIFREQIPEIIAEFMSWYRSEQGQNHLTIIENEKEEVRKLVEKLDSVDKNSSRFTDLVLYGLLPYSKTKYAMRVSTFPVFMNIKLFFKNYNYQETDWHIIASMIYTLVKGFQTSPDQLQDWINDFISDKTHSRNFQCGSISPILFCLNDSFPVINNRVIHTYNEFANALDWDDVMYRKLEVYPENIQKCKRLISFLSKQEINNFTVFDLFCYWFAQLRKEEKDIDDEEEISYEPLARLNIPTIEFSTFFEKLNLEELSKLEPHTLRTPDRIKINQIIENCDKGMWVLPNFQRYFEWKKNDVKEFLESIFNDYYVGSLLFWEKARDPQLDLIPIKGVNIQLEDNRSGLIILDGQQRITSLYYAIKAPNFNLESSRFPLYFYINFAKFLDQDINAEIIEVLPKKLEPEETYSRMLFPLYDLLRYTDWVDGFDRYLSNLDSKNEQFKKIIRIIDRKLRYLLYGYEIPYICLPESMELSQITDIFEKINTMGKRLNAFDLLIARLSIHDIDLKDLWEESVKIYPKFDVYHRANEKMPIYLLQAISLSYNKTSACSREDILNIYENIFETGGLNFDEIWHDMTRWVGRAIQKIENLRDGFGVKDPGQLPFSPTIPIMAGLMKEIDKNTNKLSCFKKLRIWYWSSVFSNAYSGAVDSQLTADFKEMRDWFSDEGKIPKTIIRARNELGLLNLREIQAKGSAIYKGILCILALKGSNDFDTGQVLENVSGNDRHHLFPRSMFASARRVNCVLNMSWMSEDTNRKIMRFEKPSEYVPKFISTKYKGNEQQFLSILESHFINKKCYDEMVKDDLEGFLEEREKLVINEIHNLLGL